MVVLVATSLLRQGETVRTENATLLSLRHVVSSAQLTASHSAVFCSQEPCYRHVVSSRPLDSIPGVEAVCVADERTLLEAWRDFIVRVRNLPPGGRLSPRIAALSGRSRHSARVQQFQLRSAVHAQARRLSRSFEFQVSW